MNKREHSAFSTAQKKRNVPNKERGFILVSVIIAITLVAAIAFALSQQGASETNVTSGELERDHLRYVAEAGMAHARLQLAKNTSCSGYTDIPKTDFGTDSYKAKFKTDEGSPVTVVATGSLGSSAEFKLQSDAVRVYQPPTAAVLQLGKTAGKDVHIDSFYDNNNYGGQADVTVRSDPGWIQRPLLEFDLSAIPTGVRIVSAKLELKLAVLTKPGVIGVHRLTRSWEEGTGKGTGNADGATWLEYDGANLWAQPGGELASTVYGSTTAGSGKLGQWVSWEIGDLVDEWVSGKSANYGLALVGDGIVDNAKFESRENPDPAVAPKLTIVFACECGKTCAGPPAPGYLDEFNNQTCDPAFDYSGSDGALDWSPWLWTEVNESDGSCAGQIQVAADSTIPDPESFRLRVIGQGVRVYRTVDLSGLTQPTLSFAYRLLNYPLDDFLRIRVSTNGGTDWTELARFTGPFDHTEYQSASYDLSAFIDVDTLIQFEFNGVSAALTSYIDNVHIVEAGSGLIAHWKFDDGLGLTALDSEGGHDGALVNGPAWVPGKLDTALDFDGSDDVVEVPQTSDLDLSTFTVSAWIRISTLTSSQTILEKRDGADLATVNYLLLAAGNEITWAFYDGGWASFSTDTANLDVDTWYHVAGTYDNSTGEGNVYVNGVLLASGTTTKNPPLVPGSVRIGDSECAACNDKWNGSLDDVRIYNRALSASEVADLFDTGSGAGYYLDEFNSLNCDPASDYTGSDGSRDWSGWQWQETLDDSGSCSGDIKILVDGGSNRLQLKGDGSGIERRVDLTAFSVATLSFDYLQDGPFDATRYLSVWASADAGSNWTEVGRIDVEGDGTYKSASFDISAHVGPNAMIRFETADLQATRKIYIDNVHIDDVPTGGGGGGGEVTFEEFTDASLSSDGLSITIPKPAGTAAGDLLIAAIVTDGENKPAMTAPAGWTLIDHDKTSKQVTMDVLWKIADASEPGSYDFSWEKSQEAYGWIMRFTGHDPTAPIHDSQSDGGTSSSPVSPAVSTTTANTMIVRIGGFDDDDITPGDPGLSGHTAVTMGASDTGTGTASGGAGYVLQSGTGDSGTSTFSLTNSEEYRAVTIAIAPAP